MRAFKSLWAWVRRGCMHRMATTTSSIWGMQVRNLGPYYHFTRDKKKLKRRRFGTLACSWPMAVCESYLLFTHQGEHTHLYYIWFFSYIWDAWLNASLSQFLAQSVPIVCRDYQSQAFSEFGIKLADCAKCRFMNFGNEAFQGFKRRWNKLVTPLLRKWVDLFLNLVCWILYCVSSWCFYTYWIYYAKNENGC